MWLLWACQPGDTSPTDDSGLGAVDTAPALETDRPPVALDAARLQARLDAVAARNDGWGGAALSVWTADGARFDGVAGDAARGGPPLQVGQAFEVASVTKTFTAALVLDLVDEGLLSLEDRLGSLLEEVPRLSARGEVDLTAEVTVRQLLQHTSGFADYWTDPPYVRPGVNPFLARFLADEDHHWTLDELIEAAEQLDPIGPPGSPWHYSDTNYVVLGKVVETRLGRGFEQALRERVLGPLELDTTWMVWEEAAPVPVLAARYEGRRDLTAFEHQSADHVGGGLASTTADLLRFVFAVAEGELFSPALLEELRRPVPTGTDGVGYGLGVFTVELEDGSALWGHDGYGGAFVYHWPEQGAAWAGTINQTGRSSEPLQVEAVEVVAGR